MFNIEKAITYLQELTQIYSVSGHEDAVRRYLKGKYEPLADTITIDKLGSIVATKTSSNPQAKTVMLLGHMDEIGFIVTYITDQGLLNLRAVGGWNTQNILGHRAVLVTDDQKVFKGTIGSVPPHLLTPAQRNEAPKIENMMLDLGFENKQEVLDAGIKIGHQVVLEGSFERLSAHRVLAKAFDNRFGCALGLMLLESFKDVELPFHLVVGASVQEEVGLRGAQTITNLVKPDMAIIFDCSPANDLTSATTLGQLGQGALVRVMDGSYIAHRKFINYYEAIMIENKINHQYFLSSGGTDAGAVHKSLDGVTTLTACICGRYIHTNSTIIDLRDVESVFLATKYLLDSLNNDKIELITSYE